ncbi:MAG TPA: ABC transporter substrate-binding protein, partial [Puia sp.]|nr:ABC transporter substrate-binding protein [Puia sp.]
MSRTPGSLGFFRSTLLLTLLAFGCGHPQQGGSSPATEKPAADTGSAAATTSGHGHTVLQYAHGFRIDDHGAYREVSILNHTGGRIDTLHYLLVEEGVTPPAGRPGIPVITTPVKTLAVLSSMHVALAGFAGVADRITGLGNFRYINSPIVREGIRTGKVKQIGIDAGINNELVISLHPGVVISMTNPDAAFGQFKTLTEAGIPVLPDADWLETTPLGRAEWVKLVGALVDREDYVAKKFDSVAQAYLRLAAIGRSAKKKPSVILGMPFKGVWYTPAGENYMAQFLRDAGAGYHWSDTKGISSLSLNVESVIPIALQADY